MRCIAFHSHHQLTIKTTMRATTVAAVLALTAASATAQSVGTPLDIVRNLLNL